MQFHYVVGYDTNTKQWFLEHDTDAYFPDGNVYSLENLENTGYWWLYPEEDTLEASLDETLRNTLHSILDTIPVPQEA